MHDPWIKFRKKLLNDTRVVRISYALNADRLRVLGALITLWCWADDNVPDDGRMENMTPEMLDSVVGIEGFTKSLPLDWMVVESQALIFPEYTQHNGSTAKRRVSEAKRLKNVRKKSASKADKKQRSLISSNISLEYCLNSIPEDLKINVKPISEWFNHRFAIKKPPKSDEALGKMFEQMRTIGSELQSWVDCAIRNGWQGLYEPKGSTNGNSKGGRTFASAGGVDKFANVKVSKIDVQ